MDGANGSANGTPARFIYRYHNGARDVAADPSVLWRKINAACRDRQTTWAKLAEEWLAVVPHEDDPEEVKDDKAARWFDLLEVFAAVARQAFGLVPFDEADGSGTLEDEAFAILTGFIGWREKKDASTATSPGSSPSTAGDLPDSSNLPSDPSDMTTTTA